MRKIEKIKEYIIFEYPIKGLRRIIPSTRPSDIVERIRNEVDEKFNMNADEMNVIDTYIKKYVKVVCVNKDRLAPDRFRKYDYDSFVGPLLPTMKLRYR